MTVWLWRLCGCGGFEGCEAMKVVWLWRLCRCGGCGGCVDVEVLRVISYV